MEALRRLGCSRRTQTTSGSTVRHSEEKQRRQAWDWTCCQCELLSGCPCRAMAVFAGVETRSGKRSGENRLSWPVLLLTLAVFTSSSFSAFSLYQLMALRAEVEGLKSDVCRRRQEAEREGQVSDGSYTHAPGCGDVQNICLACMCCTVCAQTDAMRSGRSEETIYQPPSDHDVTLMRTIRMVAGEEKGNPNFWVTLPVKRQNYNVTDEGFSLRQIIAETKRLLSESSDVQGVDTFTAAQL